MQSPPFPRYLVPPRSKYSPQHHVLKHPQLPFLLQYQRPSFTPIQYNRQNYSSIYLCVWLWWIKTRLSFAVMLATSAIMLSEKKKIPWPLSQVFSHYFSFVLSISSSPFSVVLFCLFSEVPTQTLFLSCRGILPHWMSNPQFDLHCLWWLLLLSHAHTLNL